jgi:lipid A 4'-phosphatase
MLIKTLIKKKKISLLLLKAIIFPLFFLMVLTPWSSQIDLVLSHWFYKDGHFFSHFLLDGIFYYGLIPAWITVILASMGWMASFIFSACRQWRTCCAYLVLVLAIGSGLLIHAVLKDHWGRPRPKQVIEFGGHQLFLPYYQPNFFHQPEPSKSFPCGHCSMGFYFFTFIFLGKYYHQKRLYQLGLVLIGGLGGVLSFSRLAQGGHFFSDILVSALIMWFTAFGLYHFMFREENL